MMIPVDGVDWKFSPACYRSCQHSTALPQIVHRNVAFHRIEAGSGAVDGKRVGEDRVAPTTNSPVSPPWEETVSSWQNVSLCAGKPGNIPYGNTRSIGFSPIPLE